jgi:hypothetical protein
MYSSKAYQCNIFFIRGSKTVPYLTGENITTSPTSPAAGQTTTSNAQESTTIVISIQESDSNTIQDHIPAIIGGSVGGIIVIVGVFVLHKYIYVKKIKYEGQKNGQINHFDTPAQNGPPPRDTSHDIDIDMYNSIQIGDTRVSKL